MRNDTDLSLSDRRQLHQLEEQLLQPKVRPAQEMLDRLLADDFIEFGKSGRQYNKKQTITELSKAHGEQEIIMRDVAIKALAPGLALLTYTSSELHPDPEERSALRSSIWKQTDGQWQLVFHQGTPTAPA